MKDQIVDENVEEELDSDEYDRRNRSLNEQLSDDLDGELNLSDCEDQANSFRAKNKEAKKEKRKRPARKFVNEIDTNVFKIEFKTLKDNAELATGDPIICEKCQAVFNIYSTIEETKTEEGEQQIWSCEFCNHKNKVDIENEEKPQTSAVNYIIEAAAQV